MNTDPWRNSNSAIDRTAFTIFENHQTSALRIDRLIGTFEKYSKWAASWAVDDCNHIEAYSVFESV